MEHQSNKFIVQSKTCQTGESISHEVTKKASEIMRFLLAYYVFNDSIKENHER